jgi:predicted dithiol-disulfide oxidoreductase (DUF899 family)
MTRHMTGTREEWLAARLELLEVEKELTRRSDELAQRRQELPWVRVDKEYRFETDEGSASLADLFRGRSQLLVYHFMFGSIVGFVYSTVITGESERNFVVEIISPGCAGHSGLTLTSQGAGCAEIGTRGGHIALVRRAASPAPTRAV